MRLGSGRFNALNNASRVPFPQNTVNEAINGRAAMLGFMCAIGTELATHHSVMSQVRGASTNASKGGWLLHRPTRLVQPFTRHSHPLPSTQCIASLQVAGRYENYELVEKAFSASDLGFGAIVALTTVATLMPTLIAGGSLSTEQNQFQRAARAAAQLLSASTASCSTSGLRVRPQRASNVCLPAVRAGVGVKDRSFGPFTPALEQTLGRVAMMGFAGLLLTETLLQHSLV